MIITIMPKDTALKHTIEISRRERASRAHGGNYNHKNIH